MPTFRLLALVTTVSLAGCGNDASLPLPGSAVEPVHGAASAVDASRIVTLGGPVTETVYALGFGERVVGTDRSSLFPSEVLEGPRLNYFRQTSAEGVLSLAPSVVLASEETGPPAVLDQIRATGVPVVAIATPQTVEEAEARVRRVGEVLGREAEADSLVARMRQQLGGVTPLQPSVAPRVLFVYARGSGLVQVLGLGTPADLVLGLAGATNAAAVEGAVPLTAEAVADARPEVVVIPERGLESLGGVDGLFAQPGLAQTPAGRAQRVVAVDDALLLGLGPRLGEGVAELAHALSRVTSE